MKIFKTLALLAIALFIGANLCFADPGGKLQVTKFAKPPIGTGPYNKADNPSWKRVGEGSFGKFPVIFGFNPDATNITFIQTKLYAPKGQVEIVVTNWDGQDNLDGRLTKAESYAKKLVQELNAGQKPWNCDKANCYVCEF